MLNQFGKQVLSAACAITLSFSAIGQTVTITHDDKTIETVELRQAAEGVYYWVVDNNQRVYLKQSDICEGTACPQKSPQPSRMSNAATFGIYGSNTIGAELMPELIISYTDTTQATVETIKGIKPEEKTLIVSGNNGNSLFTVELKAHGSGTSFPALQNGDAEIGMASRSIKSKEEATLAQSGIRNMRATGQEHVVALDGLVVIVSPDNPVNVLSLTQIAQLFAGEITNWSQLGGNNIPVNIYARDDNSGTYDTFKGLVLKPNGKELNPTATRFESNEALSDAVSADTGAVGFTGFAYVRNAKTLSLASECGIVSTPSIFGVKTEEYPLSRRLYLYTAGKPLSHHAKGLLDYSLSDEAQEAIADVGFINQSVEMLNFNNQGQRLANTILPANILDNGIELAMVQKMFSLLMHGDRLSTTFRFNTGSSDLDVKALQDIKRIANLLSKPNSRFTDKDIYLVGFTDSVGDFNKNESLSISRATQVYNALSPHLPTRVRQRLRVVGYSELSPVACNTSDVGKSKNRRVEIWVK